MLNSTAPRLRSFNRARKWVSSLLKRPFKVPEAHKLRNIDTTKALEHMINVLAMPGGVTYEDYLPSCLAPLRDQNEVKVATVASPDSNNATPNVQEVSKVAKVSGGVSG